MQDALHQHENDSLRCSPNCVFADSAGEIGDCATVRYKVTCPELLFVSRRYLTLRSQAAKAVRMHVRIVLHSMVRGIFVQNITQIHTNTIHDVM